MNQEEIFTKVEKLEEVEIVEVKKLKELHNPEQLTYQELSTKKVVYHNFGLACCYIPSPFNFPCVLSRKFCKCCCSEKCFPSGCNGLKKTCQYENCYVQVCDPKIEIDLNEYCNKYFKYNKWSNFITIVAFGYFFIAFNKFKDDSEYHYDESGLYTKKIWRVS